MRFLRRDRGDNPNALAFIFLLILLAIFAGPSVFPQLIRNTFSVVDADEGPSCSSLRSGEDRAIHQSLIGREISQRVAPPITLSVRTGALPADPTGTLTIKVIVTNDTIGTIPIIVTPDQLIFNPGDLSNGLGVVFNAPTVPVPNGNEGVTTYPADRIRLLGPRQVCVQSADIVFNQIPNWSGLTAANSTIKAFYRNNTRGTAAASPGNPSVYSDQGLWVGVVESRPVTIATGN